MSATLDNELFAKHFKQSTVVGEFQPAPYLSVPGRVFPVEEKYLGSIMQELFDAHGIKTRELIELDPQSKDFLKAETDFSSAMSGNANRERGSVIDWKREREGKRKRTSPVDA